MSDPTLWRIFTALFVLAGLMNLRRSLRRSDARRTVNLALAVSCFIWAAAAYLFRFVGVTAGYAVAGAAMAAMLFAAFVGAKAVKEGSRE
jgi:hypothetical protein